MQKIATRLFICASIAFGIIGISMVITSPMEGGTSSDLNRVFEKLLMTTVFVILPSFAVTVAGKYLGGKS